MRRLLPAALALAIASCATARPSGDAPADAGGRLFRSKCAACHRAYPPGERTRAQWAGVMVRMATRAHLTEAERASLLDWLAAHAKDAMPPAAPHAPAEGVR